MKTFLLRRAFRFIPVLAAIIILSFILLRLSPGDPVDRMLGGIPGTESQVPLKDFREEEKKYWSEKLGLNQPVFYFSLKSAAEPDTLHRIVSERERLAVKRILRQNGNTAAVMEYYSGWKKLVRSLSEQGLTDEAEALSHLLFIRDFSKHLAYLDNTVRRHGRQLFSSLESSLRKCLSAPDRWKTFIPSVTFSYSNQFHTWLFGDGQLRKGVLRGDFGESYLTKQPVMQMIRPAIGWSMLLTLLSVAIAYLISIPLGVNTASKPGSSASRVADILFTVLFSLPVFWIASLLMFFFCNPDFLNILPSSGTGPYGGFTNEIWLEKLWITIPYLILPTICYTYSSIAFLSRSIRSAVTEEIGADYIRTARAKGVPEKKVVWRHAFRNSLLPVITLFSQLFPFMISGSVIIESIFSIPGMGYTIFSSVDAQDYPVIIAVFTITGIITVSGFVLSDILYMIADPRIRFEKTGS